ncbi:unnamed protein product [Trichogramma brassicae]|uniref:CCHC-type domain-containing protein n=1 Tax=Trichogramma brassicae TaxID=86971 RepID=A0A6H5IIW3_9HYME|nr:unnamed protein product [Trichogramma brassicae]
MVTPTDHVRAEQRWKWARMLRDTGLTFSGAKDKLGAETFLARLERYRTKGAIPQEDTTGDMLFAVDALLVGEAQVWYESVEHKLHSWQDFERRFRRSFANQATPEELLTELRRRTQGKGEDINTYLTNFRYLCSRFREPLPYENQRNKFFQRIRKSRERIRETVPNERLWHEPVTHANQLHPRAAYKPVQARQCAAVEVSSPKAEGSSNKKSKKRKSPKKKPTSPPRTPPKEVAALEKTQAPQSNRYGERRTQWKNSNLQPSGGAIRKELRCTNCKQQGHWTTNCPTIECFKCHKKGHMARACPESEDNVERKRHSMSGLRPKRCNGAGVRPLQLLVRPFGKRAGGGAGSVAVPLKSHTRPKESDRADDALIRWLYRLEQQDKLKVPTLGEVLAHCEWPRDDTLIPMPGGGTISEWCLRDLSAAGERPAGQADEDRSRSWSNRHGMYGDSASRDGLGRGFRSTMESRYIHGPNQWRSGDGPWHNFAKLNEARSMRCDIVAECAGITVCVAEKGKLSRVKLRD